ncbi:MAG: DUF4142 domain-containing protein [Kofleriaceae bacterium]
MKNASWRISLAAAGLLAAAPGCKQREERAAAAPAPAVTAESSAAPPSAPAPAAPAPSDAQIAAIVVAANQVDVLAGQLALEKSKNAQVRELADRMVTDHTAVNKAAVELVTRLKVTPEESDLSRALTSGGADKRSELQRLDGDAFDRAYVDNEVAYHEAVIGVLKTQLVPAAQHPELKDTLVGVQPAFDAHLQHARMIQAGLAGAGAAAGEARP